MSVAIAMGGIGLILLFSGLGLMACAFGQQVAFAAQVGASVARHLAEKQQEQAA